MEVAIGNIMKNIRIETIQNEIKLNSKNKLKV